MKNYFLFSLIIVLNFNCGAQSGKWHALVSPKVASVSAIAVNSKTGRVYVGAESFVAYSDDKGSTWNIMPTVNYSFSNVSSIDIDEETGRVIVSDLGSGGVSWTDDNGATLWRHDNIATNPVTGFGVPVSVVKAAPKTGTIFAGGFRAPAVSPFSNFQPVGIGPNPFPGGGQPWLYGALLAFKDYETDPDDSIYVVYNNNWSAFDGVYKSADDGLSWRRRNYGMGAVSVYDMAVSSQGALFFATSNGIYKKEKDSTNAVRFNGGLPLPHTTKIDIDRTSDDVYILYNGVVYRSSDKGVSYTRVNYAYANSNLSIITAGSGVCYSGNETRGIYLYDTLQPNVFDNISGVLRKASNDQLLASPAGPLYIKNSKGQIFQSLSNGDDWTSITQTSSSDDVFAYDKIVATSQGHLFFNGSMLGNTQILMSPDSGKSYNDVTYNLWKLPYSNSTKLFSIGSEVFLAYNTTPYTVNVWRFAGVGVNWDPFFDSIANVNNVASIENIYKNANGRYIMVVKSNSGFNTSLLYTDNNGNSWSDTAFTAAPLIQNSKQKFYWIGTSPMTGNTEVWKGDSTGLNWQKLNLPSPYVPHSSLVNFKDTLYCIASNTLMPPGSELTYLKFDDQLLKVEDLIPGSAIPSAFRALAVSGKGVLFGYNASLLYRYEQGATVNGVQYQPMNNVYVYPVPSAGALRVSGIETDFSFTLFDLDGKQVSPTTLQIGNNLIAADAPSGIYLCRVKCESGTYTQKIAIIR